MPWYAVATEPISVRRPVKCSREQQDQKLHETQVTLKMRKPFQKVP